MNTCVPMVYMYKCLSHTLSLLFTVDDFRTVVDGVPSATIFNGPVLFVDGQYTSITNVFTGNDIFWWDWAMLTGMYEIMPT